MKLFKALFFILFLVMNFSCVKETSTPKKFLSKNNIQKEYYFNDVKSLQKITLRYLDSVGRSTTPKSNIKNLNISIDTIFYGNDKKIVFLAISKTFNPYVKLRTGKEYQDGIDYYGNSFIGIKDKVNDSIKIIHKIKYSVESDESDGYIRVKNKLRKIYFREMNELKDRYNINDTRFWTSNIWEEAEIMKQKRKSYEEMKKTNPENVYPQ
jgi:hypothetical protein